MNLLHSRSRPVQRPLDRQNNQISIKPTSSAVATPIASRGNPFRSNQASPSFSYSIGPRRERIVGDRLINIDAVFQRHALEGATILREVAADVVKITGLTNADLAEIWDSALDARILSTPVLPPPATGHLNKYEFIILLSELQLFSNLSDLEFADLFLPQILQTEPSQTKYLGTSSSIKISRTPNSNKPKVTLSEDRAIEPTNVQPSINLELRRKDGRINAPNIRKALASNLPKVKRQDTEGLEVLPSENFSLKKTVAQNKGSSRRGQHSAEFEVPTQPRTSFGSRSGGIEVTPQQDPRFEPAFAEAQSNIMPQAIREASLESNVQQSPGVKTFDLHDMESPVSTPESDKLAQQILASLELEQRRMASSSKTQKRISMISPLRRTRSTLSHGEFSSANLTAALRKAALEDNLCLVASLLNMGANINFVSDGPTEPRPSLVHRISISRNNARKSTEREHHKIMSQAVAANPVKGPMVDFFVAMGADGASIDMALTAAILANNLDLALSLVPLADVYSLQECKLNEADATHASSIGVACLAKKVPRSTRRSVLRLIFQRPDFDMYKPVYKTYSAGSDIETKHDTLSLLIMDLDFELITLILERKSNNDRVLANVNTKFISRRQWRESSRSSLRTLSVLQSAFPTLVSEHGSRLLLEAVAGGSRRGTTFLLDLGADHERYFCHPSHASPGAKADPIQEISILGWATKTGNLGICRALVQAGASPWQIAPNGLSPFLEACRCDALNVAQYFLSLNPNRQKLGKYILNIHPNLSIKQALLIILMRKEHDYNARVQSDFIDILIDLGVKVREDAVLEAIDYNNYAGLSRILERRNGKLDFNANKDFGDDRFYTNTNYLFKSIQNDYRRYCTCVDYALQLDKRSFVTLMESYGWIRASQHP
ncbi:MAG: hypothetical protein M1829_005357 [Trizodia sp. TS-e1964]|nr:MAG: hypothetical protein M1829_005357 [Trizodia sp. TS-e1964]